MRYNFGDFTLDLETHELRRGRECVHLQPKAFELLRTLVESQPRAWSKAELHDLLWPEVHVAEASLTRVVSELRAALGESARAPRFLRTLHGYGYRFSVEQEGADTRTPGGLVQHVLLWNDRRFCLESGQNLIGREATSRLVLDMNHVSRRHCCIEIYGERAVLTDLGSKNGTFLDGRRIQAPESLVPGATIEIGPVTVFYARGAAASTVTELRKR